MSILAKAVDFNPEAMKKVAKSIDASEAKAAKEEKKDPDPYFGPGFYRLKDPAKLVAKAREIFKERLEGIKKEDWIECPVCGEMTDNGDEIDLCPFCGDEGEGDDENEADKVLDGADVDEPGTDVVDPKVVDVNKGKKEGDAEAHTEEGGDSDSDGDGGDNDEPGEDEGSDETAVTDPVEAAMKDTRTLAECEAAIKSSQTNMVSSGYDMGVAIREVQKRELWKEKYKNFREWIEGFGVSPGLAYGLIDLVGKFNREDFVKVGQTKLMIVARADSGDREALLNDAKAGTSKRDLQAKAKEKKNKKTKGKETKPETRGRKRAEHSGDRPKDEDKITLLAKVGGRSKAYPFKDKKTGKEISAWTSDAYCEIKISDDVSMLIGLKTKTNKKADAGYDITGFVVSYKRVEQAKDEDDKSK